MAKSIEAVAGAHIGFTKLSVVIWITNAFGNSINQMTFAFVAVHVFASLLLAAGKVFEAFVLLYVNVVSFCTQTFECQVMLIAWYRNTKRSCAKIFAWIILARVGRIEVIVLVFLHN